MLFPRSLFVRPQRLEGSQLGHQVVVHQSLGARGVALLDGGDEHAVLVDRVLDTARPVELAAA